MASTILPPFSRAIRNSEGNRSCGDKCIPKLEFGNEEISPLGCRLLNQELDVQKHVPPRQEKYR